MKNFICVYDFETDSPDPRVCNPVQLAAIMINPITLEIVDNSEFEIKMRPVDIDKETYYEEHKDTIIWHSKIKEKTPEYIFKEWQGYPDQKQSWDHFLNYLLKYNKNQSRKTVWTAPIRAGHNITGFDNLIIDRLAETYKDVDKDGEQKIFFQRDVIDTKDICFYWFENLPEPSGLSLDVLREFFGIPVKGGHDAKKDVKDTAWLVQKFMRLFRLQAPKIPFKGAFK